MDLIGHKQQDALDKLERAAGLGSSAACATLGALLSRGWRTDQPSSSDISLPPIAPAPPRPATRPALPARKSSSYLYHTAPKRTPDALRATDLFLRGLNLELAKPLRTAESVTASGYVGASDDEEGAEGPFFNLERALDLLAGVTDSHRFGVLHSPAPVSGKHAQLPSPTDSDDEINDSLWRRSAAAARSVLAHETIRPVLATASKPLDPSDPPPKSQSRTRRPSSVSRSYSHPSSSLSFGATAAGPDESLASPVRKVRTTLAIHALYVLAVQAWALQPPFSASSPPASDKSQLASRALQDEPRAIAEQYWSTIVALAAPFAPLGGIGIKEGDELVERTQRRLEALHHQDLGADEPWRLAKKRPRAQPQLSSSARSHTSESVVGSPPEHAGDMASSAVTIRPTVAPLGSSGSAGSLGDPTPRASTTPAKFHFAGAELDEADEDAASARSSPVAIAVDEAALPAEAASSPPFALSPPRELLVDTTATSSSLLAGPAPSTSHLLASQQYPSPPETPPVDSENKPFYPDLTRPASIRSLRSRRSPPSPLPSSSTASLMPLVAPGSSSSVLPRITSTRSIVSNRSTTSVLSHFKHDPLQRYLTGRLKRVSSSASVCTAPPDFSERSRRVLGKGKGRMVEPEESGPLDMRASMPALPERALPGAADSRDGGEGQPKTWLSRFWTSTQDRLPRSLSGGVKLPDLPRSLGEVREAIGSRLERTSPTAEKQLREALERHNSAAEEVVYYWGEGEFRDEEEVEGAVYVDQDGNRFVVSADGVDADKSPSTSARTLDSVDQPQTQADRLRTSLALDAPRSGVKSQRSFLLNDPTSLAPSRERSRSRRSREPSSSPLSSSTHETTADGHLAPPSPRSHRRRRRHSASARNPSSTAASGQAVAIDPLLLELERRSRVGLKTTCGACGRRGLNFPTCRTCKGTYCGRECRVSEAHGCSLLAKAARARQAVAV
ncbi:uncharacterized protein JCM10292_005675 [Rhodotorula paludigena]|uniref:uncharacterized protein n=1 Tax=Rhodotorula paludigena TaxID=86838 RepID=UPI0031787157